MEVLQIKLVGKKTGSETSENLCESEVQIFATPEEIEGFIDIWAVYDDKDLDYRENRPISISFLKSLIGKLEASGANFVRVVFDSDRNEYTLDGFKVNRMSPEEEAFEKKLLAEKEAIKKKLLAEEEIKEIEEGIVNQIKNLEIRLANLRG